jgi:hypothetical protein
MTYKPHVRSTVVSRRVFFSGDKPEGCPECGSAVDWESDTADDAYLGIASGICWERFDDRHGYGWWNKKGSISKPLRARFERTVPRLARFLEFVDRQNGVVHEYPLDESKP